MLVTKKFHEKILIIIFKQSIFAHIVKLEIVNDQFSLHLLIVSEDV